MWGMKPRSPSDLPWPRVSKVTHVNWCWLKNFATCRYRWPCSPDPWKISTTAWHSPSGTGQYRPDRRRRSWVDSNWNSFSLGNGSTMGTPSPWSRRNRSLSFDHDQEVSVPCRLRYPYWIKLRWQKQRRRNLLLWRPSSFLCTFKATMPRRCWLEEQSNERNSVVLFSVKKSFFLPFFCKTTETLKKPTVQMSIRASTLVV